MTPLMRYQQDLLRSDFYHDESQQKAIIQLDDLYTRLMQSESFVEHRLASKFQLWRWLTAQCRWLGLSKNQLVLPEKGIYFWGGVGRGKTYLMDTFYQSLPFTRKSRMHFHRFMHRVHAELRLFDGQENPLLCVADKLAQEAKVICFDEFFVSDITDAMLLGTLLTALFERGVCLVATSNVEPSQLYKNGLQRARFLPAIDAIERYCHIYHLESDMDYRLRALTQAPIYHFPLTMNAARQLELYFAQLVPHADSSPSHILINQREIQVVREDQGVVHFDFSILCEGMRSQLDYIEIACTYHTVLLSNVKQMSAENDDAARRFIAMVDEFYERHVKLIISAEVALSDLYQMGQLSFEFERTRSRLQEMQSHAYLALAHLP